VVFRVDTHIARPAARWARPRLGRLTVPLVPHHLAHAAALTTVRWKARFRPGQTALGTRPDRRRAARLFLHQKYPFLVPCSRPCQSGAGAFSCHHCSMERAA
jgi:hypothetical protein